MFKRFGIILAGITLVNIGIFMLFSGVLDTWAKDVFSSSYTIDFRSWSGLQAAFLVRLSTVTFFEAAMFAAYAITGGITIVIVATKEMIREK